MSCCGNIRSTPAYWKSRMLELMSTTEQVGCPTIFFTLSAADEHWKGLFRLLMNSNDVQNLSHVERRKIMVDNPLLVAWYFKHRVESFMECVLKPIFEITDYWYRYEWQFRGSPHVHGML